MTNKDFDSGNKSHYRQKMVAGLFIFLIILCVIGYKVLNSTRYIVLPIQPPPDPNKSELHGEWSSVEYIVETWNDSNNSFYNWRVKKDIILDEGGLYSWESIDAYFHNELNRIGWVPYDLIYGNLCHTVLAESEFLPQGIDGYQMYKQKDEDNATRYFPIICLAIWPDYNSDGQLWMYHIVLATRNPSRWTYLNYLFD